MVAWYRVVPGVLDVRGRESSFTVEVDAATMMRFPALIRDIRFDSDV
jgi:hypothetical protein